MIKLSNGEVLELTNYKTEYGGFYEIDGYYCTCKGIIDHFLGFDKDQAIRNIVDNYYEFSGESGEEQIENAKNYTYRFNEIISKTLNYIEHEEPHTIKYFPFPNYNECSMEWCAVAKISNNGSTYIFSKNKSLIKLFQVQL